MDQLGVDVLPRQTDMQTPNHDAGINDWLQSEANLLNKKSDRQSDLQLESKSERHSDLLDLHEHPHGIFQELCQLLHKAGSLRPIAHTMVH